MKINLRTLLAVVAIALLLVFAFVSFGSSLQQTMLHIAVPGAFILAFIAIPDRKVNRYLGLIIGLYVWEVVCTATAQYFSPAMTELRRVAACFMMIYAIYQLAKDQKYIPWLYLIYIVYYFSIVYYASTNIITPDYDYTEDRLDDKELGANTVAYFTFFTTFIIFIFPDIIKSEFWKRIMRILFLLTPVLSFGVAILTGSRQVAVIQLPLIALLLYLRYVRGRRTSFKLIFLAVAVVAVFFLAGKASTIYEQSYLAQRNEMTVTEDVRMIHAQRAIEMGLNNPVFGVGPGNYAAQTHGSFSHCTYFELFANNGFPGLIIFLFLLFFIFRDQLRRYRRTKDLLFLVFLVFVVVYAADNIFYVFHTNNWLISFLFLVAMHSNKYYETHYLKAEESIGDEEKRNAAKKYLRRFN